MRAIIGLAIQCDMLDTLKRSHHPYTTPHKRTVRKIFQTTSDKTKEIFLKFADVSALDFSDKHWQKSKFWAKIAIFENKKRNFGQRLNFLTNRFLVKKSKFWIKSRNLFVKMFQL